MIDLQYLSELATAATETSKARDFSARLLADAVLTFGHGLVSMMDSYEVAKRADEQAQAALRKAVEQRRAERQSAQEAATVATFGPGTGVSTQ